MRKFLIFLVITILLFKDGISQNRSNLWLLGYQPFTSDCGINFNSGTADTFSIWKDLEFFATNASICDTFGEILFYTNGISINNKEHQILGNSEGFNPGQQTTEDSLSGLTASMGAIILPHPGNADLYDIFHISGEEILDGTQTQPLIFRHSQIDMNLNNGLGEVSLNKKGIPILNDTLVWGRISACKHSNGKDWWIITHKWNSDLFYKFLLTSDTLLGPFEQHIGSVISIDDKFGQANFSPDGSKFAYMNRNYNFDYFLFDRCKGEFSHHTNVILPDSNSSQGIAFSSNSRFLYAITHNQLLQYDTWLADLTTSMILIDTIPLQGNEDDFGVPMLAPDNKIYISTYHGVDAMHVINYPDSLGSLCEFIKLGFPLPTYNAFSIPNHPNYDLGESPGSDTCEIIYTIASLSSKSIAFYRIAPNPASDWLNIIYQSDENALFELYDLYGKRVGAISLFHYFKNRLINVAELPSGIYLASVTCEGEKIWSEKVIVQH